MEFDCSLIQWYIQLSQRYAHKIHNFTFLNFLEQQGKGCENLSDILLFQVILLQIIGQFCFVF